MPHPQAPPSWLSGVHSVSHGSLKPEPRDGNLLPVLPPSAVYRPGQQVKQTSVRYVNVYRSNQLVKEICIPYRPYSARPIASCACAALPRRGRLQQLGLWLRWRPGQQRACELTRERLDWAKSTGTQSEDRGDSEGEQEHQQEQEEDDEEAEAEAEGQV
jgi:hypothetical protein